MKKFKSIDLNSQELESVICNQCGKEMRKKGSVFQEEIISISIPFGYFSNKDGVTYHLDLCENCLDSWIAKMKLPPQITEETELL